MRPRWRSAPGSVRNSPNRCVQNAPRVVHVFWPDSRQPPPASSRTPLLWMPARSLPGIGLRPALAPRLLARGHLGQDAILLLLGAELEDRRREQEDAVLGDALRRARRVVLLLEDQPLPEAGFAAAVLAGPRNHGVARVEQGALPLEVRGEARRGCRPRAAAGRGTWVASQSRHSARNCSSAA